MKAALFEPKLVTVLREGYSLEAFRRDAVAGLTVAIVALPLAVAIAIASGTTPDKGLLTAIIAGFLISALGGSRVQIGGPTGAFIPVVYAVIFRHGYDGLVLATCMAGSILVVAGLMRFGTLMKYMPQPLITGFTAGIAVIIFSSQIPDLLGLKLRDVPAEFLPKLAVIGAGLGEINPWAVGLAVVSIAAIVVFRKLAPKAPGFLIVVIAGVVAARMLGLPVETIGSRFGELPHLIPVPGLPPISLARLQELLPDAFTSAFLAGVASRLDDVLDQFANTPRVFILRTRLVPMIDASGVHALQGLADHCARRGIHLVLSGLQAQPRRVLEGMKFRPVPGRISFADDFSGALALSRELTAGP